MRHVQGNAIVSPFTPTLACEMLPRSPEQLSREQDLAIVQDALLIDLL